MEEGVYGIEGARDGTWLPVPLVVGSDLSTRVVDKSLERLERVVPNLLREIVLANFSVGAIGLWLVHLLLERAKNLGSTRGKQ